MFGDIWVFFILMQQEIVLDLLQQRDGRRRVPLKHLWCHEQIVAGQRRREAPRGGYRAEVRKPTNTGHLATSSLVNSEVLVRGRENQPSGPIAWAPDTRPLLLVPWPASAVQV